MLGIIDLPDGKLNNMNPHERKPVPDWRLTTEDGGVWRIRQV
jgi:hypothetical protein